MDTLCPYFKNPESKVVKELLPVVFEWYDADNLPDGFEAVARRILASTVWHLSQGRFQKDYPSHEVLLESPLFEGDRLKRLADELGDHFTVNNFSDGTAEETADNDTECSDKIIDAKPSLTGVGYRDRRMASIEKNTSDVYLRRIVREESGNNANHAVLLERLGTFEERVSQQMRQMQSRISISYGHTISAPVNECMPTFKHDDGKEYLVPEDFKFPTCTNLPAFKSWFFTGDSKSKVGRFKNLSGNDIPTKNATLQNARKL